MKFGTYTGPIVILDRRASTPSERASTCPAEWTPTWRSVKLSLGRIKFLTVNESRVRIGVIGVGNISGIYLQNLQAAPECEVAACADLDLDRAKSSASEHDIARAFTPDQLLADPEIDLVLNLTVPKVHSQIALAALAAGKHVYGEKPLAITLESGLEVMRTASKAGLKVGSAPDTFLGGSHQTCREVIDSGRLGVLVGASAFMMGGGVETWHPNPQFFYEPGGGPMLDMGPYYLTALVNMLGPIRRASGFSRITHPQRTVTSQPLAGTVINVTTPTHCAATYEFQSGPVAQLTMSFDVPVHSMPNIVIYGSEGSLIVPDPNIFGGTPKIRSKGQDEWEDVPVTKPHTENSRGLGVIDMIRAIQEGRPARADGSLALHVLEAMLAPDCSEKSGSVIEFQTTCSRPEML